LSEIGAKTTGVVTVSNAVAITGSQSEVTAALVTAGSLVVAGSAVVTVNDGNSTALTATSLSAIGAVTTGAVTVTNAVAITGTVSEVNAALVTSGSKVVLSSATATVTATGVDGSSDLSLVTQGGDLSANLANSANISANSNLAEVNIFNLENNADVTMTIAQHSNLSAALGTNTVTFSNAGSTTGVTGVEQYIMAAGTNNFTMASSAQTVVGNTGADTIAGGSGNNTITGGLGLDSLSGAGGTDTFKYASGHAFTDVDTESVYETIADFTTGADKLDFGVAVGEMRYFNGVTTFPADFNEKATASFDGTGRDIFVMYNAAGGGDGYLAVDMDASGVLNSTDILIKLGGINEETDILITDVTAY
jgi:hypothetical protein